ncbi:sialidase-1-like [Lytechinus pictus]|uniref:sialidase-1-like n=1 Tax=Lytechinus pictus TaxID=7653 RepID=UPI0030B9BFDA
MIKLTMAKLALNTLRHLFLIISILLSVTYAITPFVIEEQLLWESSDEGEVSTYRIPIIKQMPNGDLLAFSEARKYSSADAGAKFIAMRRSSNSGQSWGPSVFILNDYKVPDGLNLGTVLVDSITNNTMLIHTFCVHSVCNGTGQKPSGVFMVTSPDFGHSWSEPVNLGEKNPKLMDLHFDPGPGYGIQKQHPPHKGRLITCGHADGANGADERSMLCLHSDDGGVIWNISMGLAGLPYGQTKKTGDFVPGEVQIVELKNGTILANVRNTYNYHCKCRIQAMSFDGGSSFPTTSIQLKEELLDPDVCGSILNFNDDQFIFFSNAYSIVSRINLTLHWSTDAGSTYPNLLNIYGKGSGYSCLTYVDKNHIALVYEKDDIKFISYVRIQLNL